MAAAAWNNPSALPLKSTLNSSAMMMNPTAHTATRNTRARNWQVTNNSMLGVKAVARLRREYNTTDHRKTGLRPTLSPILTTKKASIVPIAIVDNIKPAALVSMPRSRVINGRARFTVEKSNPSKKAPSITSGNICFCLFVS